MVNRLTQEIHLLLEWLSKSFNIPSFDNIFVAIDNFETEVIDNFAYSVIHRDKIYSVKDFEEEFSDLLHKGYGWINLHCAGLYNGSIIFTLELPDKSSGVPFGGTSINYSGPAINPFNKKPEWDFEYFYKVV